MQGWVTFSFNDKDNQIWRGQKDLNLQTVNVQIILIVCFYFSPAANGAGKSEHHGATLIIILAVALPIVAFILIGVAVYCRYLHLHFLAVLSWAKSCTTILLTSNKALAFEGLD